MGRPGTQIGGRITAFPRRLLIPVFIALGLTGALVIAGSGTPPTTLHQAAAAQARPNIVVIETDDQTLRSMRVMDHVKSLIGDKGVTFKKNFVNYSLCCPSRATFLTGQYAHNHRVLDNTRPNGGYYRFQALHGDNNLAVWLRDAGYYTALIGKYLNGYTKKSPVPPGWSEWQVAVTGSSLVYKYTLDVNGTLVKYGKKRTSYLQDVLTRKAVGLVDRRAPSGRPFFLWLTYTAPHASGPNPNPNPPRDCGLGPKPAPRHAHVFDSELLPRPPNFNEADVSDKPDGIRKFPRLDAENIANVQRRYRCELESLLSVDEGVKKVVDALRAKGELDSTMIVYTSDNGFFHGEHRLIERKKHIYEESIRVPLKIRGPGIPRGVEVRNLTVNADLAPTIVGVADAIPRLAMDGRSLIPIANHPGIAEGRELLIEEPTFKAIRTERYLYAEHRTGERELYDLKRDPFELRSHHASRAYRPLKHQLAARLHELQNCAGPNCFVRSTP